MSCGFPHASWSLVLHTKEAEPKSQDKPTVSAQIDNMYSSTGYNDLRPAISKDAPISAKKQLPKTPIPRRQTL
jgi:hypothetical protein